MSKKALIIGNSDRIGLSITKELQKREWEIVDISRSRSPTEYPSYKHVISEVQEDKYLEKVKSVLQNDKPIDLCIYCAGIGELLDIFKMGRDIIIFEINLIGMVKTAFCVIPMMVKRGKGHFIGLSSVAD